MPWGDLEIARACLIHPEAEAKAGRASSPLSLLLPSPVESRVLFPLPPHLSSPECPGLCDLRKLSPRCWSSTVHLWPPFQPPTVLPLVTPSPMDPEGLSESLQVAEKVMARSGAHLHEGLRQQHILPQVRELPSFLCKGFKWLPSTVRGVPWTFHPTSLLLFLRV